MKLEFKIYLLILDHLNDNALGSYICCVNTEPNIKDIYSYAKIKNYKVWMDNYIDING